MRRVLLIALLLLAAAGCARAEIRINEVLSSNGIYENGHAWEWIELKNTGSQKETLAGLTLTFERNGEKQAYALSGSLAAGRYAVIHCIENDAAPAKGQDLYAPMSLSRKGGVLALTRDGETVDSVELGKQYGNVSFGRVGDGDAWQFLPEPSRGAANAARGYDRRAAAPLFSLPGGFYDAAGEVALSAPGDAVIRYTLDGSEPTENSSRYAGPLSFSKTATCIRAKAFETDALPSETVTGTYFVGLSPTTPVVSLVTDEKYISSSKTGLMVPGNGSVKNYFRDWEYPVSVEYFDQDGSPLINQMATFRITGATSRSYGQKSISLFARSAYGSKTFAFNPFDNRNYAGYKALTLRAAGTESFLTRFRDAMLTARAQGLDIAYQESRTVIAYINGQYWGQYNLRERINKHFLAQWEGITDEKVIDAVTIIKGRGEVQQGSIDEWNELIQFCKKKDLRKAENLQWIDDRLDIDNYFTNVAIQMIVCNTDIGNQRMYKFPGGKWKCVLYDLDEGFQHTVKGPISYYKKSPAKSSKLFYHEPFAALIRVPEMKDRFFTIMGRAILHYLPDDLLKDVDAWAEKLEPLMADQIKRWPKCSPKSMSTWKYEVKELKRLCRQWPAKAVIYACDAYGIGKKSRNEYFAAFYQVTKK